MRALTVRPGIADSLALAQLPEPDPAQGEVLVHGLSVGLCGTDLEIVSGAYGQVPPATTCWCWATRTLDESAGRRPVRVWPRATWSSGIVRRPDPVPCRACAAGA